MSEATRFREDPDAQRLADALRTRYTARREQPDDDELSADLRRLGDIEAIPAVAKPGVTAAPMKAARAVLRVVLRPWLAVQTQTNHEVARRLQRMSGHVSHLLRRTPEIEDSLQHLDARLRTIEGHGTSSPASPPLEPGLADLERMFVHMHLGRPPARVLVLGSTASVSTEIAAFGFNLAPVADERVDIVIALPDDEGRQRSLDDIACQAARLLRPGGRLLGAWRAAPLSVDTPSWRSLFEPQIVLTGERSARGWEVREQSSADTTSGIPGGRSANVMIEARRLDAPGR